MTRITLTGATVRRGRSRYLVAIRARKASRATALHSYHLVLQGVQPPLPALAASARARLPDSAFAYVDSRGRRRLPIHDASHVRNALARFDQTAFEDDVTRERARRRLLRAAKKYGIVPIGFFDGQLRKERLQTELKARARDIASLPRGSVTFLLTDIEGSTGLTQRLGDGYATVLRDVRALIRRSVREAGGHEVDARADEFFAAFRQPARALEAAVGIQRSLGKREWPDAARVRVRIGLHTGRTTLTETGYVGVAVHTAARVCSAGHGGQILLSSASRDALEGSQADGLAFRTLGRYALAGLPDPEMLFQVHAADLRVKFPRLRTTAVTARLTASRSR
jgi:class 3 adenylate cyclase